MSVNQCYYSSSSKFYNIGFQRYSDLKIRFSGKDSIPEDLKKVTGLECVDNFNL